ncbi:hypothetical protein HYPSUDRAFT_656858 [Hypholoma sublateritium FD-334 SS-4]|uniref:Uncharacterized protein n=1 Tax=Hypholoma sublateritium (strain FD-334 SS-4) TaxID=945553 RepID=A0A0D2L674_HYPSF|nr:hypothetical protein HYPSUDRAFT_656858 [Hypholoma sublateritium FD-334 SS-4]
MASSWSRDVVAKFNTDGPQAGMCAPRARCERLRESAKAMPGDKRARTRSGSNDVVRASRLSSLALREMEVCRARRPQSPGKCGLMRSLADQKHLESPWRSRRAPRTAGVRETAGASGSDNNKTTWTSCAASTRSPVPMSRRRWQRSRAKGRSLSSWSTCKRPCEHHGPPSKYFLF